MTTQPELEQFLQDHHGHVASIESAGRLYTVKIGALTPQYPDFLYRAGTVIHCCRFSRLEIK